LKIENFGSIVFSEFQRGGERMTNTNLLKSVMVLRGDENYVEALAALLGVARGTASSRIAGKSEFTQSEIAMIAKHYDLTAEDINKIFIGE